MEKSGEKLGELQLRTIRCEQRFSESFSNSNLNQNYKFAEMLEGGDFQFKKEESYCLSEGGSWWLHAQET